VTAIPSLNGIAKDTDPAPGIQPSGNVWICKGAGFPDDFVGPDADLPPNQANCNEVVIAEIVTFDADADTCNEDDDGDGEPCAGMENPPGNGPPESGANCAGANANVDNDNDGVINDGCPNDSNQDNCPLAPGTENYIPGQTTIDCDGGEIGEGLGAFEVQVKYDHKLFQQPAMDCQAGILNDTGRDVQPQVTVITENWTLFGCVTKDPTPGDGNVPIGPNPPQGLAGYLTLRIQPDLFQRIRPTKDNGVVTDLLDENCEVVDIYGMPFAGSIQGGLTPDCADATLTIRMLEGDTDLNCVVDVADDQAMAFRFGSFFGSLLYNRFFDVEPNIAPDFDIDIKDLQTVFGRNGSTCAAPIPEQDPDNQIPDP
jgi:hypothetical protein